jgi:hypothetical protein
MCRVMRASTPLPPTSSPEPSTPSPRRTHYSELCDLLLPARRASRRCDPPFGENGRVLKKAMTLLVVGFGVYYLLTAPAGAADAVSNAFGAVIDAFGQVGVFARQLSS